MSETTRAALWMIGAICSFTLMAISGRQLGGEYDTFEIMMYRSALGVIIVLAVAARVGTIGQINRDAFGLQIVRNIVHFTGQNLWFFALTMVPLAQLFAFEFTTPLWVIILSPLLLGERLTGVKALAAMMGFVGILIVARPTVEGVNIGMLAAAGCAVFFALTFITTKKLTSRQTITGIMFYLTVIQLILGLICAGYDGDIRLPTAAASPYLLVIAICGLVAHFCIAKALSLAPATIVAPIDFVRLPVIAIIGMVLYNEALDIWVFVGALIIFGGNYLNIWSENRKTSAA
ncbi:DMT family transporter [Sulfitobacter sp. TSTF-M16]|uniref:DMT family transporter n=1 Tax=Sulfitobacter aestuariivivens TaxID=2766981 RepID=A0A927D4M0_9RHOB|nr:DMT family transporter [Sulfitobacter aestuariivivens]MBD3663147.1 DMT family transporter [Sulfitobacter aestuariivivens]